MWGFNSYQDQQKEYMKQQKLMERAIMQQQRAVMKEQERSQREYAKWIANSSKYPKLTDKFVRSCLARELYMRYKTMGVNVPEPESLETRLRFKRVTNDTPDTYNYRGRQQRMIKHACPAGLRMSVPDVLSLVYVSPNGEQFNHSYGVTVPYMYCSKCHTVIYYFNGVDTSDEC
jgi:hypothetical protein